MSVSSYGNQDWELEREVDAIRSLLAEKGPLERDELAAALHARRWGPGRLREALRAALEEGAITRVGRARYSASTPRTTPGTPGTSGTPRPA